MRMMIPEERVAALIGKDGHTKISLEKLAHVAIKIEANEVSIEGDPIGAIKAAEIVRAISRGFVAEDAFQLLDDSYRLDIISLEGETERTTKRLLGRVIGEKGRSKKKLERYFDSRICIYGKTIGIIGKHEDVSIARSALEMLLTGRSHAFVYKAIEKRLARRDRLVEQ